MNPDNYEMDDNQFSTDIPNPAYIDVETYNENLLFFQNEIQRLVDELNAKKSECSDLLEKNGKMKLRIKELEKNEELKKNDENNEALTREIEELKIENEDLKKNEDNEKLKREI